MQIGTQTKNKKYKFHFCVLFYSLDISSIFSIFHVDLIRSNAVCYVYFRLFVYTYICRVLRITDFRCCWPYSLFFVSFDG
jgi:hypothetical protein